MPLVNDLIIIGDRVLVEPQDGEETTRAGLVLPATVKDRDTVRGGRVVKTGPGYVIPNPDYSEGEVWQQGRQAIRYLPLQAEPDDFAFFLRKEAFEIVYKEKTYLIVPHAAILALVRPDPEDVIRDILEGD